MPKHEDARERGDELVRLVHQPREAFGSVARDDLQDAQHHRERERHVGGGRSGARDVPQSRTGSSRLRAGRMRQRERHRRYESHISPPPPSVSRYARMFDEATTSPDPNVSTSATPISVYGVMSLSSAPSAIQAPQAASTLRN